jgi:hypothetical protein
MTGHVGWLACDPRMRPSLPQAMATVTVAEQPRHRATIKVGSGGADNVTRWSQGHHLPWPASDARLDVVSSAKWEVLGGVRGTCNGRCLNRRQKWRGRGAPDGRVARSVIVQPHLRAVLIVALFFSSSAAPSSPNMSPTCVAYWYVRGEVSLQLASSTFRVPVPTGNTAHKVKNFVPSNLPPTDQPFFLRHIITNTTMRLATYSPGAVPSSSSPGTG